MEDQKKLGITTVAGAIFVALAAIVFSENPCAGGTFDQSILNWLLICLQLNLYEEIPGNFAADHIYIPTTYILLLCIGLVILGLLWHRGIIPAPNFLSRSKKPMENTSSKGNDA